MNLKFYDVIDRTTSNYNTEASPWPVSRSRLNVGNFTKFVFIVCASRGKTKYIKTTHYILSYI